MFPLMTDVSRHDKTVTRNLNPVLCLQCQICTENLFDHFLFMGIISMSE